MTKAELGVRALEYIATQNILQMLKYVEQRVDIVILDSLSRAVSAKEFMSTIMGMYYAFKLVELTDKETLNPSIKENT